MVDAVRKLMADSTLMSTHILQFIAETYLNPNQKAHKLSLNKIIKAKKIKLAALLLGGLVWSLKILYFTNKYCNRSQVLREIEANIPAYFTSLCEQILMLKTSGIKNCLLFERLQLLGHCDVEGNVIFKAQELLEVLVTALNNNVAALHLTETGPHLTDNGIQLVFFICASVFNYILNPNKIIKNLDHIVYGFNEILLANKASIFLSATDGFIKVSQFFDMQVLQLRCS